MARRSSGVVAPHTPSVIPFSRAQARHGVRAGQARQIRFASLIWRSAGPVAPIGKNRSGSAWRQAASSRQVARAVIAGSSRPISADIPEGEPWGAAAPHQQGDLMPVDAVGVDLGQRPGHAQALYPGHASGVHGRLIVADGLLAGGGRFHRSSFSGTGLALDGAGAALAGNLIGIACSVPLCAYEHRGGAGEQASSDCGDSAGRWLAWQAGRPDRTGAGRAAKTWSVAIAVRRAADQPFPPPCTAGRRRSLESLA